MAGLPNAELINNERTGKTLALADCINSIVQPSGTNHAPGLVPDPGATPGTVKFLREDATWQVAPGSGVDSGIRWNFDTSTTMADPGSGNLRFNNATLSAVTAAAISNNCAESGNPSVSGFIAQWDASLSAVRGYLIIKNTVTPQNFAVYSINGASVNNATWFQLALGFITSGGSFSAADKLSVQFSRTGDIGGALVPAADSRTGSATITIPAGATKLRVTLVGGGGGGGGADGSLCNVSVGGPGGPAGGLIKYLSGLTPGNTLALTIGAAGTAGGAGANGGNGGDTTLASGTQTITTLTASKGSGGVAGGRGTVGTPGAAGTATNGDLNIQGGAGYCFMAPTAGPGSTAIQVSQSGAPPFGLGVSSTATAGSGSGIAGRGFGAGGTGGIGSGSSVGGSAGTAGVAIFEWYI